MLISHDREKLIEAIVYFAKNTELCGKTKLMKLLYFLDFTHFRQTGKSVTGLDYYAWDFGPVPEDVWRELKNPDHLPEDLHEAITIIPQETTYGRPLERIVPRRDFDDEFFSPRELKIMVDVAQMFREADADLMVDSTHMPRQPWEVTCREKGMGHQIDYRLAGGTRDSLPDEVIAERVKEISEMVAAFGHG